MKLHNNCINRYFAFLKQIGLTSRPDILLINPPICIYKPNNSFIFNSQPPFGIGMLATIANNLNHPTCILDAEAFKFNPEEISSIIKAMQPAILGITLTSPSVAIAKLFLNHLNYEPNLIVAGGIHPSIMPSHTFQELSMVDAVFVGEAEEAWKIFLSRANNKYSFNLDMLKGIDGILLNNFDFNQRHMFLNYPHNKELDLLPYINIKHFCNQPEKKKQGYEVGILSSRGCPYKCEYCACSVFSGSKIRYRSIINLIDEIKFHYLNGIKYYHFADDNFTAQQKRIFEFRKHLEDNSLHIRWKAFSRTTIINDRFLKEIKRSGCHHLVFGIESGSDDILKIMSKNQTINDIMKAVELCNEHKIKTTGFFMIGYPGETKSQINETIRFASKLPIDLAFFFVVRAFPGTNLFNDLLVKGFTESDLLTYKTESLEINCKTLSKRKKNIKDILEGNQLFNINECLRFHMCHDKTITTFSNEELASFVLNAYSSFYYSDKRLQRICQFL